jgi:uncharacterized protein (TIGR03435 family)
MGSLSSAQQPTFEVASIKPNTSGRLGGTGPRVEGTTFTAINVPVQGLISNGYDIPGRDIDGPRWIFSFLLNGGNERYDITAKFAAGSSPQDQRAMVRSLLQERFGLRVHRESRQLPVYILSKLNDRGSLGPNLRTAAKNCLPRTVCEGRTGRGTSTYKGAAWASVLQSIASGLDGGRLVDRTGLSGFFDFELTYPPLGVSTAGDLGVVFFTAVRQELGLQLEPGRAPFETLVVDSIARPTPD